MAWQLPDPRGPLLLLSALLVAGCVGDLPKRVETAQPAVTDELPPQRVQTLDGSMGITVPGSMSVHRFDSAILAATPNGEFRISVSTQEPQPLLVGAGSGKETLLARGWVVEGEQHYEKAILARFRKGGNASRPKHRRETWWIQAQGANLACDGIATRDGFESLGDPLRELCRSVTVERRVEPAEVAPSP